MACKEEFQEFHDVDDRETPTYLPCPLCGAEDSVEKIMPSSAAIWNTSKPTNS